VGLNYLPYSVVGVQGHTVPSVGEMNGPQNLPEWEDYISGLTGKDLFSQTVAANTQGFGRRLVAEVVVTIVVGVILGFSILFLISFSFDF